MNHYCFISLPFLQADSLMWFYIPLMERFTTCYDLFSENREFFEQWQCDRQMEENLLEDFYWSLCQLRKYQELLTVSIIVVNAFTSGTDIGSLPQMLLHAQYNCSHETDIVEVQYTLVYIIIIIMLGMNYSPCM